jgi:hypothetical protein
MPHDLHETLRHHRCRCAILTLFLLVLTVGATPAGAQGPATPAPSAATPPVLADTPLEVDEPWVDLGSMVKGTVTTHTFVLRNTGSEPLTITRAFPSCGCTVTKFDETIPPGGEGEVEATVDTATVTGRSSTSIGIFVEGHRQPAAVLELQYEVGQKLLAHPGYARWIYVQHEEQGTITQTVYSNDGADFDVLSVTPPIDAIDVSFHEASPEERREDVAGSQWVVSATLDADAPVGTISGFLEVKTTHPLQKVVSIPVSGFVRPALFVEPANRHFGELELAAPRTATYNIRNFATDPIALESATTDLPGVSAALEALEPGRNYKLVVRFDPASMEEGPFDGAVRISTDSEKIPVLTIDLAGTFVRRTASKVD